jgi:hypothetical protein
MSTLYDLATDIQAWNDAMELASTDEDLALCSARVSECLDLTAGNVDRYTQFMRHLESQITLAKEEERRLVTRRHFFERALEAMQQGAIRTLEAAGMKKLSGNTSTLKLRQRPESVAVTNESMVPDQYQKGFAKFTLAEWLAFAGDDPALCVRWLRYAGDAGMDKTGIMAEYKSSGRTPAGCEIRQGLSSLKVE